MKNISPGAYFRNFTVSFCIVRCLFQFKDCANFNIGLFLNLMLAAFYIKIFKPRKFFNNGLLENSWIPCTCSIAFKVKRQLAITQNTQESSSKFFSNFVFFFQLLSRNCHIQWIYKDLFYFTVLIKFSSLGMEVLIIMNSWKLLDSLHSFLKIPLFYFAPLFCILSKRLFPVRH